MHEAERVTTHIFGTGGVREERVRRGGHAEVNRRQYRLDLGAMRLVLWRQHQALAEVLDGLIDREAGRIRRQLEEHAARLPEVDRVEVVAIDHRRRMQPTLGDALA